MKFTKDEELIIGDRVCNYELTILKAKKEYKSSLATVNVCMRLFRSENGITFLQKKQ
jgi:hypothetical protein